MMMCPPRGFTQNLRNNQQRSTLSQEDQKDQDAEAVDADAIAINTDYVRKKTMAVKTRLSKSTV